MPEMDYTKFMIFSNEQLSEYFKKSEAMTSDNALKILEH